MVSLDDILLLGDPLLHRVCAPIKKEELSELQETIEKLAALVVIFRTKYGRGRAIAAPQIGVLKQLIVLNIDKPVVIMNPVLTFPDQRQFEIWDDCMSFPNLLVRIKRYRSCTLKFTDSLWKDHTWHLEGSMSELIQHEYDHLQGILATQRAVDNQAFQMIRPDFPLI